MFGIIAKKKKVDGGQGDAVVVLVDGDHLVFGIIAKKKVNGGQGDAVVGLAQASVLTAHGSPPTKSKPDSLTHSWTYNVTY